MGSVVEIRALTRFVTKSEQSIKSARCPRIRHHFSISETALGLRFVMTQVAQRSEPLFSVMLCRLHRLADNDRAHFSPEDQWHLLLSFKRQEQTPRAR
jgi:hypothetical protein